MRLFDRILLTTIAMSLLAIALNLWSAPVEVNITRVAGRRVYSEDGLPVQVSGGTVEVEGTVGIDGGFVEVEGTVGVEGTVEIDGGIVEVEGTVNCLVL